MDAEVTLADLIRNGTMSADMAALLWAAVDEQISFLTAAQPRLAGKSTTSNAALAMRPASVPIQIVTGQEEEMTRLERKRLGGYLVVEEFSSGGRPNYIWGGPVRRVFAALDAGYSIQACLHAPDVETAIRLVAQENEVGDAGTSAFKLVLLIERFGEESTGYWRRLAEIYELHGVENARPIGHSLFRWHADGDRFEKLSDPHQFGRDADDLARRAAILSALAADGRTTPSEVADAVASYRERSSKSAIS